MSIGRSAGVFLHNGRPIDASRLKRDRRVLLWLLAADAFAFVAGYLYIEFSTAYTRSSYQVFYSRAMVVWLMLYLATCLWTLKAGRSSGWSLLVTALSIVPIVVFPFGVFVIIVALRDTAGLVWQIDSFNRRIVCATCGYDLRGLRGPVCPECGTPRPT